MASPAASPTVSHRFSETADACRAHHAPSTVPLWFLFIPKRSPIPFVDLPPSASRRWQRRWSSRVRWRFSPSVTRYSYPAPSFESAALRPVGNPRVLPTSTWIGSIEHVALIDSSSCFYSAKFGSFVVLG